MSRQKGDIMRDVLISLKPYYYYLIGEGIKRVEVRKTYPKADDWSRNSWFYMSRDEKSFAKIPKEFQEKYRKHFGKVGMRFVCDKIDKIFQCNSGWVQEHACISREEYFKYLGLPYNSHFDSKGAYAWHINDLVVYDNPRELSEFYNNCNGLCFDNSIKYKCIRFNTDNPYACHHIKPLTRPPQSWCYIEPRQTAD